VRCDSNKTFSLQVRPVLPIGSGHAPRKQRAAVGSSPVVRLSIDHEYNLINPGFSLHRDQSQRSTAVVMMLESVPA